MKKSIFSLAALGLIFVSCSNDEMLDKAPIQQTAIGFTTTIDKNTRGVTDITTANIPNIKVWGYESQSDDANDVVARFTNQLVEKNGSDWTYTPTQYWTIGNYYWFCGYNSTNESSALFTSAGTSVWPATAVTPATNQLFGGTMYFNNGTGSWTPVTGDRTLSGGNGNSDLVYAWWKTNGAVERNNIVPVGFTMKHILSKVAFKFVNQLPESSVKITKLQVKGVPSQGTLDMKAASPAWVTSGNAFDMNYSEDISTLNISKAEENAGVFTYHDATSGYKIFIPDAFNYVIYFEVELYQNNVLVATYEHNVKVSDLTLEIGKAYILTATLNVSNIDPEGELEPIQFLPTVDGWDNSGAADVDMTEVTPAP